MNSFEKNAVKIADYLEDKMNASEEEVFMQELAANEMLRQQYEDELLVRALLENQKEASLDSHDPLFQPADEHIDMIESAFGKKDNPGAETPVIKLFRKYRIRKYRIIAAASLLIIAILLPILFHKKATDKAVVADKTSKNVNKRTDSVTDVTQPQTGMDKNHTSKDHEGKSNTEEEMQGQPREEIANRKRVNDSLRADSVLATRVLPLNRALTEKVFAKLYAPYTGSNRPVELTEFYEGYKEGNYTKVLSATEKDYQLMGSGDRNNLLKEYMNLYKGLSYLAENKPVDAIQRFELVSQASPKTASQYYAARWYSALAWLKIGDKNKVTAIAKDITGTASPFRLKGIQLLEELNEK